MKHRSPAVGRAGTMGFRRWHFPAQVSVCVLKEGYPSECAVGTQPSCVSSWLSRKLELAVGRGVGHPTSGRTGTE